MPIHNRQDFHAFAAFGETHSVAATLGRGKRRIDETLVFVEHAPFAQRIGQLREDLAQDLALAPLLKPAMDGFVIRIVLGQQVPLRARVQNPEHSFLYRPGGDRLAARAGIRNMFFRKMFPDAIPLVVAQAQHNGIYTYVHSCCQQFYDRF